MKSETIHQQCDLSLKACRRGAVSCLVWITVYSVFLYLLSIYSMRDSTRLLLLISVLLVGLPFTLQYLRFGRINPFSSINIFIMFFALFWVSRSFYIAVKDYTLFSIGGPPVSEALLFDRSLLWSLIALAVMLYCYYFWIHYLKGSSLPLSVSSQISKTFNISNYGRVEFCAYLFFGFVVVLYLFVMHKMGGIVYFVKHWGNLRFQAASGRTVLWFTFYMLQPVVWLLWACCFAKKKSRKRGSVLWLLIVTTLAGALLFTIGSRSSLLLMFAGITVIYHYMVRLIPFKKLAVIGVLLIVFAVSARFFRHYIRTGSVFYASTPGAETMSILDYAVRDFTFVDLSYYYMGRVPSEHDYLWGRSLTDIPTFVIPRKIWPAKPVSFGPNILIRYFFPDFEHSHISPSLIGDLYINFSYTGVLIGMALLGIICAETEYCIVKQSDNFISAFIIIMVICLFFSLFKYGIFGGLTRTMFVYLLPLFLILESSKILVVRSTGNER